MKLNYSTIFTEEVIHNLKDTAKEELAALLGKDEVDVTVQGVISAIEEILDRTFAIGHIISPDEVYKRGSHFFKMRGLRPPEPNTLALEVFERNVPEKLAPETIGAIACLVKSKIMTLFYREFILNLKKLLANTAKKQNPPAAAWNARDIRVGEKESLHDLLHSTVAPAEPENWFAENFLRALPASWQESFNPGAVNSSKPIVLYRNNGVSRDGKKLLDLHWDELKRIPVVRDLSEQAAIKRKIEERSGPEREWIKQDFIAANGRLAVQIGKYTAEHSPQDTSNEPSDFVGDGHIGLFRALQLYKPEKGNKFSTYATGWVRQGVTRGMHEKGRTIRVPVHAIEKIGHIYEIIRTYKTRFNKEPDIQFIAQKTGLPEEKIVRLMEHMNRPISMESQVSDTDDRSFGDTIASADDTFDSYESAHTSAATQKMLTETLNEREEAVIRLRKGIPGRVAFTSSSEMTEYQLRAAMAKIQAGLESSSFETLESKCTVVTDEEKLPILDLIASVSRVADIESARIVFQLKHMKNGSMKKVMNKARSLIKTHSVAMETGMGFLRITCSHDNPNSIDMVRGNIPQLLGPDITLSMQSRTVLMPKKGHTMEEINAILESESGILSHNIGSKFRITVDVMKNEKLSLEEIAGLSGVTREAIRQTELKATRKLRFRLLKNCIPPGQSRFNEDSEDEGHAEEK